jgi:hypothetical protein
MMSDDDLAKLAEDIKAHGLQEPVRLYFDDGQRRSLVLDGRNRLEALARLGVTIPKSSGTWAKVGTRKIEIFETLWDVTDPAAYVIGANIRRRHLTKEQQAELILKAIEAGRIDSANVAESIPKAKGRSFNLTAGKKGGSTKDPILASAITEAKKHGISKRTVERVRAKVQGKVPNSSRRTPDSPKRTADTDKVSITASSTPDDPSERQRRALDRILLRLAHVIPDLESLDTTALVGIANSPDDRVRTKYQQLTGRLTEIRTVINAIEHAAQCPLAETLSTTAPCAPPVAKRSAVAAEHGRAS